MHIYNFWYGLDSAFFVLSDGLLYRARAVLISRSVADR